MLQIGSLVDNKYKILSEVGHGGMSVVYLAINERANKTWAVKEIRKDGVCNFEAVKQGLVVETDMLKRLNHPHLPSIIDVIDTEDSFLIVMDYIEGKSLQSVLKNGGAQPQEQVIEWGKQLCDVLDYLHTREPAIIYRDMKPANVMLKPDGNITLIDFGTAREFKNRTMVEDTTCLGTRGYAAPEQFGGRGQTDARTDIYCTGATLYHLLTGHSPAEPPYEIKPLRHWDPNFAGTGIEKVIQKCCQLDPAARYQDCGELMYALEHVKDEDDAARRSRRMKWIGFLSCVIICLCGIIGMIGFNSARGNAELQTYSYYLKQGESNSSNISTAYNYYKSAISIDPGNAEAYNSFLEKIVLSDAEMNDEEKTYLLKCLNDTNSTGHPNSEFLERESPAEYAELMCNIGIVYAFQSRNDMQSWRDAANYFEEIKDSPYLSENKKELANSFYVICSGYQKIDNTTLIGGGYSHAELWSELEKIMEGNLESSVGDRNSAIAVLGRIAYMIEGNCSAFKSSNISEEAMISMLNEIEAQLNAMQFSEGETRWKENHEDAMGNVQQAKNAVEQVFNGVGVNN